MKNGKSVSIKDLCFSYPLLKTHPIFRDKKKNKRQLRLFLLPTIRDQKTERTIFAGIIILIPIKNDGLARNQSCELVP